MGHGELREASGCGPDGRYTGCMKKALLAGAVLAIAALLAFGVLKARPGRSIGAGPAGPRVPREAWSTPWRSGPVLFVGLGDSVTAGYGASPSHGYVDRLACNPADEFDDLKGICLGAVFPGLRSLNLSVSGTISQEHVARQLPKLPVQDPATFGVVAITTGGNDLIHDYGRSSPREGAMYGATVEQAKPWIDAFEKRVLALLEQVRSRFPGGCRIFLATIFDPTDGVGDIEATGHGLPAWKDGEALLGAYNGVLRRAAAQVPDVILVDVHAAFLGHGIHCAEPSRPFHRPEDPHYWYFDNLEDPNDRGYDAIRRLFLLALEKALAPKK
jgi:lysophospholipase L1-like esterase